MTEKDFTRIGKRYNKIYGSRLSDLEGLSLKLFRAWKPKDNVKVCDLGAGTGLTFNLLNKSGWNFNYLGIEPSRLYKQLKTKSKEEGFSALRGDVDRLKDHKKSFDVLIYLKSLHEIIISKLLVKYKINTNRELHKKFLDNTEEYSAKKLRILKNVLRYSIAALRNGGIIIVTDMYYPFHLNPVIVNKSIKYTEKIFKHLNYREQMVSIEEIERCLKNSLWFIVDIKKSSKRKDPNIKSKIYTLIIKKTISQCQ